MVKVWMLSSHPVATAWLQSVIATLVHHGGGSVDYGDVPYIVSTFLPVDRLSRILRRWVHRPYLRRYGISVVWSVSGGEVHVTIMGGDDA